MFDKLVYNRRVSFNEVDEFIEDDL